jgi:two-component system, LytTR family, sensor histidine kinase AgrC
MPTDIMQFITVFLITYSAFLSAYILVGQKKIRSAYIALLPSILSAPIYYFEGSFFTFIGVALLALAGFFGAFYLSKKNLTLSSVFILIALSLCLSFQLILAMLDFKETKALLFSIGTLIIPAFLWISKFVIFPEDYILTEDQKKTAVTQRLFFFPGLIILIAWQIFLLSHKIELSVYLLAFTILIQLVVLMQLWQQVRLFRERIENIIDKEYQSELLNFMRVIRSQRHDFNFHTQTIYGMIENGQYEECKEYVHSMMETVKSTNDILPLYNPATSALLNTFSEMAIQKGLQIEIEIHDNLQFISSSVYETNTIIGNLLQNAIDELELHPENESRMIKLLIIKRGQNNIIKVSNQCHLSPEEMSRVFMPGFTTKKSHEGLGLANALHIAEKYGGTVYPEFENQTVHFIAKLPIKNQNT